MSDVLINWFVTNLGGKVGKELILFIISMVPILELRGGLLAAGPAFLNVELAKAVYPDVACDSGRYHRKSAADSFYPASDHKDF